MDRDKFYQALYVCSTLAIIVGALPILSSYSFTSYLYAFGVLAYALYSLYFNKIAESSLVLNRVSRMNRLGVVFLILSLISKGGYWDNYIQNAWVFALLLAAFFIIYANILALQNKNK